jgi:hypothetical protein
MANFPKGELMTLKIAAVIWVLSCTGLIVFINIFKPKK